VRLAGFQTVLSTLVPKAAAELARLHPGIELNLIDAHPAVGLNMLRSGHVDIALIFRNADAPADEEEGFRLTHLLDDPLYLISDQPHQRLEDHRDSAWVGGCERCRSATITACERAGFSPRIAFTCDDTVIAQAVVAAGMGVAIVNGLALHAHRAPGVHATQLTDSPRQIYAATYGDPPDPPATTALIEIIASAAMTLRAPSRNDSMSVAPPHGASTTHVRSGSGTTTADCRPQ
jgi:DNA-binding transcriptional LysR family regulator